ncbi:YgcG family protein [Pseudoruegeria sp. HB172150]|uniref:TPM domain-containing protein n=1 Tax=Pseudoruegeria sp. HB172150 TaxID=2721164 RepID=UPI001557BEF5|nr:TPM domain-containing protein [Pseudoruegeria sp. HB172150]
MTRYDLRFAGLIALVTIAVGLAIGFAVGWMTRPDAPVEAGVRSAESATHSSSAGEQADGIPGYQDVYVNDYADLLDPAAEEEIRGEMIGLYDRTGVEMTVLTIDSLGTYGWQGSLESFATALFNDWGIGNAESNDGVLVLVSEGDRRMRIEIGAGYASSWDDRMQRVIDDGFLPDFREENYQAGILNGVEETIYELTGLYPGEEDSGTLERGFNRIARVLTDVWVGLVALAAGAAGALFLAVRRHLRNRPRRCAQCDTWMQRAGEQADDAHLDGGQQLEEFLKSVDYDVWYCPSCGSMEIKRYPAIFSSLSACPACSYRTLRSTTEILEHATTSSTGRKRVTYDCENCGHHDTEIRTIPKKSESSSGSSRSSFGGGSSSGGGASGSW